MDGVNLKWYQENKENRINKALLWNKKNNYRRKEIVNKHDKKCSDQLSDSYLKRLLCDGNNLTSKKIPIELVKLKKIQLMLKRKLMELKNGNK